MQTGWQSPWTNRLLLDANFSASVYDYGGREREGNETRDLVRVTDTGIQSGIQSVTYRSMNWNENHAFVPRWKVSGAYVTGAHSFKVGYMGFVQDQDNHNFTNNNDISYTFRNGVPQSLTMVGANPIRYRSRAYSQSAYVQEQWTLNRLTLQGAARYDYARSIYPHQTFGGSQFHPRVLDFPTDTEGGVTGFHDINPRLGVIYDLTGDGKTSVKFNAGRYTDSASSDGRWTLGNPMSRIQTTVGRSWNDANVNFRPDCDLLNPAAQDLRPAGGDQCGAWNNNTFGTEVFSTSYDPDMFKGWFTRPMDWEVGASVQREIRSGMSIEVGYHRRWIDKWTLIENTLNTHADFDPYSVVAPTDPRLGVANGRVVDDLWNISQAKFGQINNETYLENNAPGVNRKNWWQGVDVNVNARLAGGLTLRGGAVFSTNGDDWCTYIENGYYGTGIPEGPSMRNCKTVTPIQTELKGLGSYTIPKITVQVAGTFTSRPGPAKVANVQYTAAEIARTLGRAPSGGVQTITINAVRDQRGVLREHLHVRPADRQAPAVRAHARQPRDRHLQRAQLEHGADLQRHLHDGQPVALGHADADHAGALREDRGADRFLRGWQAQGVGSGPVGGSEDPPYEGTDCPSAGSWGRVFGPGRLRCAPAPPARHPRVGEDDPHDQRDPEIEPGLEVALLVQQHDRQRNRVHRLEIHGERGLERAQVP